MDWIGKIYSKVDERTWTHFAFGWAFASIFETWYLCLLVSFAIGILKELIDRYYRNIGLRFDWFDVFATVLGGFVALLVLTIKYFIYG